MKAMPMRDLRNTRSVRVVNYLLWVVNTCKIPLVSLVTHRGDWGIVT